MRACQKYFLTNTTRLAHSAEAEVLPQQAGQIAAMVKKEQPAAEIIREVMQGAEPILKGAAQWIG